MLLYIEFTEVVYVGILPSFKVASDCVYIFRAPIATDQLEEEESPAPLSKLNVFLLNIFFYGLSVMYLIMSVEGKYTHPIFYISESHDID